MASGLCGRRCRIVRMVPPGKLRQLQRRFRKSASTQTNYGRFMWMGRLGVAGFKGRSVSLGDETPSRTCVPGTSLPSRRAEESGERCPAEGYSAWAPGCNASGWHSSRCGWRGRIDGARTWVVTEAFGYMTAAGVHVNETTGLSLTSKVLYRQTK